MDEYPGNARRPVNQQSPGPQSTSPAEEKLEPVVTGPVIRRKAPLGRRILNTFFRGEGGVVQYLVREVLVPALQNLVIDTVTQGIEKAVGAPSRPRTPFRGGSMQPRTHISYNQPTTIVRSPSLGSVPARRPMIQPSASSVNIEEIIVDSQMTAQLILEKLYDRIRDYNLASVANLKELLNESAQVMDYRWGWTEDQAEHFSIRRAREGWALVLPEPVDIR